MPKIDGIKRHTTKKTPKAPLAVSPRIQKKVAPKHIEHIVIDSYDSEQVYVRETIVPSATRHRNRRMSRYILGILLGLVLCIILSTVFRRATVTIVPRVLDVPVSATISIAEDRTLGADLLVSTVTFNNTYEDASMTLSELTDAKLPATGEVMLFNPGSSKITVPKNTKLVASNKKVYLTDVSVLLPAKSGASFGQIAVSIHAAQVGPEGNAEKTDFTLPDFKNILGRSTTILSGGAIGKVYVVPESAKTTISASLPTHLSAMLRAQALRELPAGYTVLDQFSIEKFEPIVVPPVSADATLRVPITGTLTVSIVNTEDLKKVLLSLVGGSYMANNILSLPSIDGILFTPSGSNQKDQSMSLAVSGTLHVVFVPSLGDIQAKLAAVSRANFEKTIASFESVGNASYKMIPPWIDRLPTNPKHIRVVLKQ